MTIAGPPKNANTSRHKEQLHGRPSKCVMDARKIVWCRFIETLETDDIPVSNTDDKTPSELVEEIEKTTLKYLQEIKLLLFKRNESRILQDGKFKDWNKQFILKVLKVRDYITLEELKKHNRNALKGNLQDITRKMQKYKSNLRSKLILRQEKDGKLDPNLNLDIREEWERLLKVMPLCDLVVYSLNVLKDYKLGLIDQRSTSVYFKKKSLSHSQNSKLLSSIDNLVTQQELLNQDASIVDSESTVQKNKPLLQVLEQNKIKEVCLKDANSTKKKERLKQDLKSDKQLNQVCGKVDAQSILKKDKMSIIEQKETRLQPRIMDFNDKGTQHFQCARIKERLRAKK